MMIRAKNYVWNLIVTLLSLGGWARASENGALYVCDSTVLSASNLCLFVASATNTQGASPHDIDRSVGPDGYRLVASANGSPLTVTPKPWTQGDHLIASNAQQDDNTLRYTKAFELVAPLRDATMYAPETIINDEALWQQLTRAFVDCGVKTHDEPFIHPSGGSGTAYGVNGVYEVIKDPGGVDVHHFVLQFLEEGAIDLVCLLTDLTMDRCDVIRASNSVAEGDVSQCWESAYNQMYPSADVGSPPLAPAPSSTGASLPPPSPIQSSPPMNAPSPLNDQLYPPLPATGTARPPPPPSSIQGIPPVSSSPPSNDQLYPPPPGESFSPPRTSAPSIIVEGVSNESNMLLSTWHMFCMVVAMFSAFWL